MTCFTPRASIVTLAAVLIQTPIALAQTDAQQARPAAPFIGLDEIVVTARKVAENLQDVPVAVTVFTGEDLIRQNAREVMDIADRTPGLLIRPGSSTGASAVFQLRGQIQNDIIATLDSSVGVYVDEYYWARAYGVNANLLDIASVQVLKGPQGTLFGRNTTGGAILITTNDPDPSAFNGSVSAKYGRFDEHGATGVINVPLVQDKLAVRLAAQFDKQDGYVRETTTGKKLGERDNWTGRVKVLARPTEALSIILNYEHFKTDALTNPYRMAYIAPDSAGLIQAGFEVGTPTNLLEAIMAGMGYYASYIPRNQNRDEVSLNVLPRSYAKTNTFTGTINYDTSFGAIKFITGLRKIKASSPVDLDGSIANILDTYGEQDLKQYSQELQITGSALNDSLEFAAGVFHFDERGYDFSSSFAMPALNPNNPNFFDGHIKTKSQGIYGQATYRLTEALSLTGGLRYSSETKGLETRNRAFVAELGGYACTIPGADALNNCSLWRESTDDGISYLAGLDYQITDDTLIYIKTTQGFRSGGQNSRAASITNTTRPFKPERVNEHELGFKSEFLDRRVRFNAAAFYSRVKNMQRTQLILSDEGTAATAIVNAGKMEVYGFEAELMAVPAAGLELGGSLSYTHPKYLKYTNPTTGADQRHERFVGIPKWQFSLSAGYTHAFEWGTASIRGDYSWVGKYAGEPSNDPTNPYNDFIVKASTIPSQGMLNARAAVSLMDERFELALYGRNLTDNRDPVSALSLAPPMNHTITQLREPRTFGVQATYRFGD